jgi:hypothetical protein
MHDAPRFAQHEEFQHMLGREPAPERSSGSRVARFAALALLLALLPSGLGIAWYYSPGSGELPAPASRMQEAPATAAAPSRSTALLPVAEATKEPATAPAAAEASPPRAMDDARAQNPLPPKPLMADPSPPAQSETAPAQEVAVQPTANISELQPGGTARLIIAVAPQGELYIDGKHYGTTPPITTLDLEPGMHRIEIRSGSWKPYLTYMAVQAGDQRRIRHDFAAKPIRPPG